ncbi:ABC transporter substrate-binding protein [Chitinibacteraceae bacterium HSL-7]
MRLTLALLGFLLAVPLVAAPIEVLHWWTAPGEQRARQVLAHAAAANDVQWRDHEVVGGAGQAAFKVLKSRMLAGKGPQAAQVIGPTLNEWGDLGLLLELDDVARVARWHDTLFPTVNSLVTVRGHVVAVPLGIHRSNWLYYNRAVLSRLGLEAPRSWAEFEKVAPVIKAAGITPLQVGREPWQISMLFDAVLLAEVGPAYYRALFAPGGSSRWFDARVARALEQLRRIRPFTATDTTAWQDLVSPLVRGQSAMWVMGDWAQAEFDALPASQRPGCIAAPGTQGWHLYSIDTLVMLAGNYSAQPVQEALAAAAMSTETQRAFNRAKGSVPVRQDVEPTAPCARESWQTFARGPAVQAPSLTHRMATDEVHKDALIALIVRFYNDPTQSPQQVQRRIATLMRALNSP